MVSVLCRVEDMGCRRCALSAASTLLRSSGTGTWRVSDIICLAQKYKTFQKHKTFVLATRLTVPLI